MVFLEVQHNNALDIGIEGGWTKSLGAGLTNTIVNSFGLAGLNNSSNAMNTFGVPIQSFSQIAPYTGLPGAGLYQLLGSDFQATLRAIAQAGNAHLLSRPSVLARDRQPAEILVGQKVPLITGTTYTGVASIPVNNITYQNVGIQLNVTPFITGNLVEMIVQPSTSAIDSTLSIPISAGVNAPVIDIRSADTVVTTPDGQTVVIGGLMEADKAATVTKVPFLGDIPLLGHLFKRTITSSAKTELIIFLTPHIVQAPTQLAAMSEDERKNMLSHKADSDSERELDQFLDKRDANGYIRGTSKLPPGGVQSQRVTPP